MTLVSIIIPVYNVEDFIYRCITSCISQTYKNIEIIIVNDGSTDSSLKIIKQFEKHYPSMIKVIDQCNRGVTVARNRGIEAASGEWLLFVDSDDYIDVNAVSKFLENVLKCQSDISIGGFIIKKRDNFYKQPNNAVYGFSEKGLAMSLLDGKVQFSLCGKIFRKSIIDTIDFREDLKIGEDAFATIQAFSFTSNISFFEDNVYYYDQRVASVMNSPSRAAILSRSLFVSLVHEFYRNKNYFEELDFQIILQRFCINEYFGFLRMGGCPSLFNKDLLIDINNNFLKNGNVLKKIPFWRIQFLTIYRFNIHVGNAFRQIFNIVRNIIKKIEK